MLRQNVSDQNSNLRIDEILLKQGLVTESQITEALEYQRQHGGRLGSHLLRLGFVDERGLVEALAGQFQCDYVVISELEIPSDVLSMIPATLAVARTVVPFAYDKSSKTLSVACENPRDETLQNELAFVAPGKKIKLYVAAEAPLRSIVTDKYVAMNDGVAEDTGSMPIVRFEGELSDFDADHPTGSVLLVSDEHEDDEPLRQALEREGYKVTVTETADEAIGIIGRQTFDRVFIRDTVQGDYIDLIDRVRKASPRTFVHYFESPGQLLLDQRDHREANSLMVKNLQLFTSLLATRENTGANHASTVGHYVEKLCEYIGLPTKERMAVVVAAYLHDISRYYYGESKEVSDCRAKVKLTVKLLDSLNFPPLVIGVLHSMYIDLRQRFTKRLPIEVLGGNILTIVDIFCEHIAVDRRMSLDRFEAIRQKLNALTGKLFLAEVVVAFVQMIQKELLIEPKSDSYNQVMMYSNDVDYLGAIVIRLKEEGFRPVALDSRDKFIEMFKRSRPDMMILLEDGSAGQAITLIDDLVKHGVDIMKVPTFLVATQKAASELTSMFEKGLEDIIPLENSLDLLVMKMQKLRARVESRALEHHEGNEGGSTAGKLEDMNLIDLLQAMGPSCKTARIKINSQGNELTLCLNRGQIVYAEADGKTGAEAVYEGVAWGTGKWVIQPLAEDELPEPNNDQSNESILMEGCRRLDEQTRVK